MDKSQINVLKEYKYSICSLLGEDKFKDKFLPGLLKFSFEKLRDDSSLLKQSSISIISFTHEHYPDELLSWVFNERIYRPLGQHTVKAIVGSKVLYEVLKGSDSVFYDAVLFIVHTNSGQALFLHYEPMLPPQFLSIQDCSRTFKVRHVVL